MQAASSETQVRIYQITWQHNKHFRTWEAEGRKSNFVLEIKHYVS